MLERTFRGSEILVKLESGMARYNIVQCGVKSSWWQFPHSSCFTHKILSYWIPNSWVITILPVSHLRSFPPLSFISTFCFLSCCKESIISAERHTVDIATLHISVFLREVYTRHVNCKVSTAHAIWVCPHIVEKWSEMATTTVTAHGQVLV
jgi:hypothetical protein